MVFDDLTGFLEEREKCGDLEKRWRCPFEP